MKQKIDLVDQIPGTYWHAAAILKLESDPIIRVPLEELRFEIGGGAITRRVDAEVGPLQSEAASLRVPLQWKAAEHPNLFPVMHGELRISDIDGSQIELRLVGEYRSPLGAVGAFGEALAGRRVAEKTLRGFLTDAARRLEDRLVAHTRRAGVEP
jgi:hypothetical protein